MAYVGAGSNLQSALAMKLEELRTFLRARILFREYEKVKDKV